MTVFRDALRDAIAPHRDAIVESLRDAIVESLRAQRHVVLEESVAHYEAEARRLRAEADKLTRRAARCRDLLSPSTVPVDAAPAGCEDVDDDVLRRSQFLGHADQDSDTA